MGSLVAALLPALLAVEPSSGAAPGPRAPVLLSRRVSVPAKDAASLTAQVTDALNAAGSPVASNADTARSLAKLGLKDATTCNGKPACLSEFGRQLGADWLVLTSVSKVAGERSLALELFDVSKGEVAERDSLLLPKGNKLPADLLAGFAGKVTARLAPPPAATPDVPVKPQQPDAPVVTELTPPPRETMPPPPPPPEPRSHAVSWALGAAGIAALGAGVALLAVGLSTQGQVNAGTPGEDGRVRSPLTASEAQAKAGAASVQFGLAGAAAAVGLGLTTTAVILW
ncbi:MAG: hypothetical protein AB1938_21320 [Myxococcota bacterium]